MDTELRELLERLHDKYNRPEFIECDPISVPHRYAGRTDREIAGFFAATIAWGNRKAIVANGHRMMRCMDDAPADFVRNASEKELASLSSYAHRTFNGGDLRDFVLALRRMEELHGGIGSFFETRYEATRSIPAVFAEFRREFFSCGHAPRCEKHLSSIEKGAACKRLCMYLRWMVRSDGRGVDFGEWTRIPMSALYIPLDVHTGNMSRALGLLTRRQNDWRAVEQTTASLRMFDPPTLCVTISRSSGRVSTVTSKHRDDVPLQTIRHTPRSLPDEGRDGRRAAGCLGLGASVGQAHPRYR